MDAGCLCHQTAGLICACMSTDRANGHLEPILVCRWMLAKSSPPSISILAPKPVVGVFGLAAPGKPGGGRPKCLGACMLTCLNPPHFPLCTCPLVTHHSQHPHCAKSWLSGTTKVYMQSIVTLYYIVF